MNWRIGWIAPGLFEKGWIQPILWNSPSAKQFRGKEFNKFCPPNSSDDLCIFFCIYPSSMYATPTIVCLALYRGVLCCLTRLLPVIQRLCLHLPLSNCPLEQFTCYACKLEWCDVALFAIFENAHHAVNQVYFYESNSKRSANMAASVQIITGTLKMVFALLVFLFIFSFYQNLKKNPILGKQSKSFRGSVPIYKATLKMWNFEIGVIEQFCTACRVLSLLSLSEIIPP